MTALQRRDAAELHEEPAELVSSPDISYPDGQPDWSVAA